jgi:Domain of unknown function (DUF6468)
MGGVVSFIIELTVIILLGLTVTYCIILDRRLQRLRADETSMRQTVVELGLATERAERSIDGLRNAITECDRTLGDRLRLAEEASQGLMETIRTGDEVLGRIGKIVGSARQAVDDMQQRVPQPEPAIKVSETLAAAEAFALRARRRNLDHAA